MNPGSADQALDSVINVDIEWMQQFYAGLTKPPDPSRSSSSMDEELEMELELINIMSTAKKRSCMIAAPASNTGRMGSCYSAMGMKSELDMRRIAASLINSVEATSVTTMAVSETSCGMIVNDMCTAANTSSGLHKYSSALLPSGPPPASGAPGSLCRGLGAVKVKKKRIRPSRRVPTTVLKTDTSNFKAMVEHFTGIPTPAATTQESTTSPSASSSSPPSTSSASSPSFSKPLPHPAVCKISKSSALPNPNTSVATATCPFPVPSSASSPTCQYLPEVPSTRTVASITASVDIIPNSAPDQELAISLIEISKCPAVPNPNTLVATATCPLPVPSSSSPTCQSVPEVPSIRTAASITSSVDIIPNSAPDQELTMSLIDTAFFDELWS